jgi:nucleoside-diphosphate-sugar epimerase
MSTIKMPWHIQDDFAQIANSAGPSFEKLKNAQIFLTGGTGFIGRWILESIAYVNQKHQHHIQVSILTRDPDRFQKANPHLINPDYFQYIAGDVLRLSEIDCKALSSFTHIIHAATDASAELNETNPLHMFDTVVFGTRQVLEFVRRYPSARILYLSSGAVYGQQPIDVKYVDEDSFTAPDCKNPRNTYAEAKRAAEMLCAIYRKQFDLEITCARIFALLGPFLNLNIHFAAGNFIRDALANKKIMVSGDGRPERSYLYPTDLITWLLTILTDGHSGATYNVGSEEAISIGDLAHLTAHLLGGAGCEILGLHDSGWNPGRYVPSNALIRKELGVVQGVALAEAIIRTALANGWRQKV